MNAGMLEYNVLTACWKPLTVTSGQPPSSGPAQWFLVKDMGGWNIGLLLKIHVNGDCKQLTRLRKLQQRAQTKEPSWATDLVVVENLDLLHSRYRDL